MKLSVVIPCYNESKNIPLIYQRISELGLSSDQFEIVFVNNGSTDDSSKIFKSLDPDYDCTRVHEISVNQGYGFGILSGLNVCSGDFLGWTHSDLQTDLKDIVTAYEILVQNKFDSKIYIKGKRVGRPIMDRFFTGGMSLFESILLGNRLQDINAQPNIFHKSFYETWVGPPSDFSLDLYSLFYATKMKLKITRFPVLFVDRIHGESNWNTGFKGRWKFIQRTLEFSFKLRRKIS